MIRGARTGALIAGAIAIATARPAAADLESRVLVLPSEGSDPAGLPQLGADVASALARGAARITRTVSRADAPLSDTAVIVGCDPAQRTCLDAVAAALNVDQVVFARVQADGDDAKIEVTAVTRETEPSTRTFPVRRASRAADLAAIEAAVVDMLQSGEARRSQAHQAANTTNTNTTNTNTTNTNTTPTKPPPPPPVEHETPTLAIAVTITGGVLLAAGATSWALASSKQGEIDRAPADSAADLDHLASLESSARTYATAGNVLVIGGAAVAVAGAVLWWRSGSSDGEVAVAPMIGPDRAGFAVAATW